MFGQPGPTSMQQTVPVAQNEPSNISGAGSTNQSPAPISPLADYAVRSEGTFGSLAQVGLEYYNPAYQEGSEEKQASPVLQHM